MLKKLNFIDHLKVRTTLPTNDIHLNKNYYVQLVVELIIICKKYFINIFIVIGMVYI